VQPTETRLTTQPGPIIDAANRLILTPERAYPWPPNATFIAHAYDTDKPIVLNGNLFLSMGFGRAEGYGNYALDLATGHYGRVREAGNLVQTSCGLIDPYTQELSALYPWWYTDVDGLSHFCNLFTGEVGAALPDGYAQFGFGTGHENATSFQDGRWVVFFATFTKKSRPYFIETEIFAYYTRANKIVNVGYIPERFYGEGFPYSSYSFYGIWEDRYVIVNARQQMEWSANDIFVADLQHPQRSMIRIDGFRFAPKVYQNPLRIVTTSTPSNGEGSDVCSYVVFDIRSGRSTSYHAPKSMCQPEYGDIRGVGYYRDVSTGSAVSRLVRYDAVTQEQVELYRGEIEFVFWVSPDERYALLVLDEDGKTEPPRGWNEVGSFGGLGTSPNAKLVWLDLKSGRQLYQARFTYYDHLSQWPFCSTPIHAGPHWFSSETSNPKVADHIPYCDYKLLIEDDGRVFERPIRGEIVNLDLGVGRFLVWGDDSARPVLVHNIAANAYISLIPDSRAYEIATVKADIRPDGVYLTFHVWPKGQNAENHVHQAEYVIRIP
jgi:hypothetical protein